MTANSLVEAIPGPQSWNELAILVEQRPAGASPARERGLRLLAYFLSGQAEKMKTEIDKGEAEASKLKKEYLRKNAIQSFNQLRFFMLKMAETDEPSQLAVQLDQILDFQKKVQSPDLTICLPDLVGLADRKVISESEPRRLIEKALATPEVSLAVPAGGKTLSLAQQITLSKIDQLLVPQWQLVASLDSAPLYKALTNRFPEEPAKEREHMTHPLQLDSTLIRSDYYSRRDESRKMARQYYLAGLLAQNRTNEASEILLTIDESHYFSSWQQFARAENFVKQLAAILIRQATAARHSYGLSEQLRAILIQLAKVYNRAGRFQDTVTRLDQAPWWGAGDLLDIALRGNSDLAVVAAEALATLGRNEEADKILKTYLTHITQCRGDDSAYRVLVARGNDGLIPWLDQLYARDRFEERPLIWKAWLQLKAGQLTNAEATIRLALKVDPTDGEQKAGDRVYAYSVLADVLSAQGKTSEAAMFRNVVAAVRLAEKGDEFTEAGLIKRSLPFYEQAEKLFKDAYCVQWRLAARLATLGNSSGAERHYALAFTHMPLQFGQVASFCFGCEGAFDTLLRRNAAEGVLLKQAAAEPKRPQVYYLLGQLREAQMRYAEACQYYQQALEIDPDYLDVWEKIYGMKETIPLTNRQLDGLILKMRQLDPLQRHSCSQLNHIYQLKELWRVLEQNQKYAVERPESLLVLTAAKEQLEKKEKATREFKISDYPYYDYYSPHERRGVPTPGEALAQQEFIVMILNLMQMQPVDY